MRFPLFGVFLNCMATVCFFSPLFPPTNVIFIYLDENLVLAIDTTWNLVFTWKYSILFPDFTNM